MYSFLNRGPTTANQVSHIPLLLLLFQNSFIYTGCLYRHKLILLPFSQKETNSFPSWHELTKVTGLRSQPSCAWGSAIKFQTSQIFKRSSGLKIQNYIFKATQDILLYLLLSWEAEVPGSNTTLSSSSLSSHRSPQSSSQEGTQPTYTSYNDCKRSREKNGRYSSILSHPSIQQNIEKQFKIHHTPSELHRGTRNFKLR